MPAKKKQILIPPGRYPARFVRVSVGIDQNNDLTTVLLFELFEGEFSGEVVIWTFPTIPFLNEPLAESLDRLFNDPHTPTNVGEILGNKYLVRVDLSLPSKGMAVTSVIPLVS